MGVKEDLNKETGEKIFVLILIMVTEQFTLQLHNLRFHELLHNGCEINGCDKKKLPNNSILLDK